MVRWRAARGSRSASCPHRPRFRPRPLNGAASPSGRALVLRRAGPRCSCASGPGTPAALRSLTSRPVSLRLGTPRNRRRPVGEHHLCRCARGPLPASCWRDPGTAPRAGASGRPGAQRREQFVDGVAEPHQFGTALFRRIDSPYGRRCHGLGQLAAQSGKPACVISCRSLHRTRQATASPRQAAARATIVAVMSSRNFRSAHGAAGGRSLRWRVQLFRVPFSRRF